jgi:hypothetical protein
VLIDESNSLNHIDLIFINMIPSDRPDSSFATSPRENGGIRRAGQRGNIDCPN